MSGLRALATAPAVVSLFIIAPMMPPVSVDAAPQAPSRDADMEYLETFEAGEKSVDPLDLEQLETGKKRTEKSVKKKRRFRVEERASEKDEGNE